MEDKEKLSKSIDELNKEYARVFVYKYNDKVVSDLPRIMHLLIELLNWILANCFDKNGKFDIPLLKLFRLRKTIKSFIKKL